MVHLAGMMGAWKPIEDYRSVNVTGTDNVWRAALDEGVSKMVHVSSWTVYGMGIGEPAREDFPLRPFADAYPLTKASSVLCSSNHASRRGCCRRRFEGCEVGAVRCARRGGRGALCG